MRGSGIQQDSLFSTVNPASRVPEDHPLRTIRTMADTALKAMDADFAGPLRRNWPGINVQMRNLGIASCVT